MRKKSKSAAILAVVMAMTLAGSSAVYAEENSSAKTAETDDNEKEDTRAAENEPAPCNEGEHELIESKVVLPTCTERGYTIYKCKADGCTYEEKRDETAALGHELKEVSMQEATADKPGVITYKCQRQGCDYTELAEIPVKNTNTVDGKTDDADTKTDETPGTDADSKSEDGKTDASEEDKNSNTENASVDKDNTSGKTDPADSDTSADSKNEDAEEELPEEDIDEEYASYASSTSTDIVTEYDPETAVGTICVAKKDSDDPTETEEVTGMTVPAGTTEIKKDADGNITDLAVSTAIDEVKNGFSLTSENKKLHSISISDKKNPKDHWITLSAKESATELGIRLRNGNNKIIITFHDEDIEKPLFERFTIFIKNIGPDSRSKIDDFNIKYRLVKFFREAEEILTNEFHQYSLDECFELLKQQGIYDGENPFLHKTNRYYKNSSECCLNCLTTCDRVDKVVDNWCEKYTPNREEYYTHLLKAKGEDEPCSIKSVRTLDDVLDLKELKKMMKIKS